MKAQIFTLDQARALIPWLREATAEAEQKARKVQLEMTDPLEARERIRTIIHHWSETAMKLGALPKQPFTVDFDSGTDYFCWEYPEKDIYYRHGYEAGYAGRQRISEETPETAPEETPKESPEESGEEPAPEI